MTGPCLMVVRGGRGCGRWGTANLGGLSYCGQHHRLLLDSLERAVWEAGDSPETSPVAVRVATAELARRQSNRDAITARAHAEHQAEIDAFHAAIRETDDARTAARENPGPVVYFVRNEESGAIKIGTATDPQKRLWGLRTASAAELTLLATTPGDRVTEHAIHDRFHAQRIRGEWFRPAPELLAYVESLAS